MKNATPKPRSLLLIAATTFVAATSVSAMTLLSPHIFSQTASFVKTSTDLGQENPDNKLQVRLWLKLRHPDQLSNLADQVTDNRSSQYQKWITHDQFEARFAPLSKDLASVRDYLISQDLTPTASDPGNLWVSASGTVAQVEKAFQIQIHNFLVDGKLVRANTSDPIILGDVGNLVTMVGGLNNRSVKSLLIRPTDPNTGKAFPSTHVSAGINLGDYTTQCFHASESHVFSSADGTTVASYAGTRFGADPTDVDRTSLSACGYDPATIQSAYGLNALYRRKLDGTGQTVVIVDAFGSPTIQTDIDTYDQLYQLPPAHLNTYQPGGPPVTGAWNPNQSGWAGEVTLDVDAVHTVAPGANNALVEALTDSDDDLIAGVAYAVENQLGNVISDSWVGIESQTVATTFALDEAVFQSAVVQGISVQYGSGDYGDYRTTYGYSDVSYPSSSRYVTAVGGTSLAVNADGSMWFQTGWGNNQMQLTTGANLPLDPPQQENVFSGKNAFLSGSGGGTSRIYPKPSYQRHLPGLNRMVPDISFLGDGYTGLRVLETEFDANGNPEPGIQSVSIVGGTSASCPFFTAMWAIANQRAGRSLGLAAAKVYRLPAGAITDILPVNSELTAGNITGSITDSTGVNAQSALQLGSPETSSSFLSSFLSAPDFGQPASSAFWFALTFGTDSSLSVTPGWDSVTGLGTPNGEAFVDAAAKL